MIKHLPVMLQESINSLNIKKNGIYIDATYGCGGHTKLILSKLGSKGRIYAVDCDIKTILINKIIDKRIIYINEKFSNLINILDTKVLGTIDGILFDLGLSSFQLNDPKRGFSFIEDGPLDMRFNQKNGITAAKWIQRVSEDKLSYVLKNYGEEKFAKKIAYNIKQYIIKNKLNSTDDLSKLICSIIYKFKKNKKRFKHPATRSFQAIRIFINKELEELKKALYNSLIILRKGGIISVISFHSLEDRIIKKFMKIHSINNNKYHFGVPLTEKEINNLSKNNYKLKIINRIFPNSKEIYDNPRSRSAILRVGQKI
ncbi:16S rRNA (cytosine(1402)-N(4))-methyltransferase RsmH [Enterobacteriaceae endosymbiont of Plateumaris consimilis]|uniref:16S rRNA (cytosine(1402)-N(4))-methyltransferase RsmH n=1 Tax=Enterobacteriaceae endosymbiont of Plateumaris consimilis TaxID=2675794 RepID=UPI001448DD75|nr:16S rRNA (cytosine(1402)-N(4))-methyltransferase RsmH [Enterobacteriaceae endosymbiont of Plateumaris consimilis]QJC28550.1 16S rRNA (cytosine(1402)-N(4))-methyltransferase RsmH [Enterobacteriaceae endosymbiont of Plateumaris consimilis]